LKDKQITLLTLDQLEQVETSKNHYIMLLQKSIEAAKDEQ
jgi:hypothetical protein